MRNASQKQPACGKTSNNAKRKGSSFREAFFLYEFDIINQSNTDKNQTYTDVISSVVEKSPAGETARCVPAPAHLPVAARHRGNLVEGERRQHTRASQMPAVAHCREIPRNRNENNRTRLTQTIASGGSLPQALRRFKAFPLGGRWHECER